MRTVDPEQWSRKFKESKMQVSRRNRFGQRAGPRCEALLRGSVRDAARELAAACCIPAVKHITAQDITKGERYCYIVGFCLTLALATVVVVHTWSELLATPPITVSELSSEPSAADVNFPAVAICGNNIISKIALQNHTELLFNHPKNQERAPPYNRSEIERNLLELGHLILFAPPTLQVDALIEFDSFLIDVYQCAGSYCNISDLMFELFPPCAAQLARCAWRGEVRGCETLFAPRVTALGYCCVFNSRYHELDAKSEPITLNLTGMHYGLGVVLANNDHDVAYRRRSNWDGPEVLVFAGAAFPLLESGDVRQLPAPRRRALALAVTAVTQHVAADTGVSVFGETRRGCRLGAGAASMSACLAQCRLDAARALCSCEPFTLRDSFQRGRTDACALRHLHCLNEHREKLVSVIPWVPDAVQAARSAGEELRAGMSCRHCVVPCARRLYAVHATYSRRAPASAAHVRPDLLSAGLSLANSSTVLVFFTADHRRDYVLEPYITWHEILGILSMQWMVLGGVSVPGVLELLYHAAFRWTRHVARRASRARL